jgi:glycerol-3-phosphate dehydrogenase
MAEDVIDIAIEKNNLSKKLCVTKELKLYGHDHLPYPATSIATEDIKKAIHDEMCMTAEDFLSRRTRHLLLNAKTALEAAPLVTKIMAAEMNKDENWIREQINDFTKIAKNYLPSPNLKHQTLN